VKEKLLAAEMGLRDLTRERTNLLCQVLAFAAILAPLLVLQGLKSGTTTSLIEELLSDPRTLEVNLIGDTLYDGDWVEALNDNPFVGFAIPHTRSLAASVEFLSGDGDTRDIERASLLASRPGDPLLGGGTAAPGLGEVVVTQSLADALNVAVGDQVTLTVPRQLDGEFSNIFLDLRVIGEINTSHWSAKGALVDLPVLIALERWRDGFAVPEFGWEGREGTERADRFANVRLYANSLQSVRPLVDMLTAEGYNVASQLATVEGMLALQDNLNAIFGIVAVLAVGGYVLAFSAALWANIVRKTPQVSLLRLQGIKPWAVIAFPVAQALVIALIGAIVAIVLSSGACSGINAIYAVGLPAGTKTCELAASDFLVAVAGAIAVAAIAASAAALRIMKVNPAEGLSHA
jgi:putative ABC transport system permease protein